MGSSKGMENSWLGAAPTGICSLPRMGLAGRRVGQGLSSPARHTEMAFLLPWVIAGVFSVLQTLRIGFRTSPSRTIFPSRPSLTVTADLLRLVFSKLLMGRGLHAFSRPLLAGTGWRLSPEYPAASMAWPTDREGSSRLVPIPITLPCS
jgi:hypothetical protein